MRRFAVVVFLIAELANAIDAGWIPGDRIRRAIGYPRNVPVIATYEPSASLGVPTTARQMPRE